MPRPSQCPACGMFESCMNPSSPHCAERPATNPFYIGDRVTLKDRTYYDGTVVDVDDSSVKVYWRKSDLHELEIHNAHKLARKV